MTNQSLVTENLRLRPFTPNDVTAMVQILNGKDVLRYFPGNPSLTREQVQRMIERLLAHWQEKGYGLWAVESQATGALLGRCGLQFIVETDEIEIDFILDRHYWGRGFATEAGRAAMEFGFRVLQLETIVGIVHPENIASQRVLEKLGMSFVTEAEYFGMACYKYAATRPSPHN